MKGTWSASSASWRGWAWSDVGNAFRAQRFGSGAGTQMTHSSHSSCERSPSELGFLPILFPALLADTLADTRIIPGQPCEVSISRLAARKIVDRRLSKHFTVVILDNFLSMSCHFGPHFLVVRPNYAET